MVLTDGRLMGVSRELNTTADSYRTLTHTLNLMERELRNISATVAHKQQLMEDYHRSGLAGSNHTFYHSTTKEEDTSTRQPKAQDEYHDLKWLKLVRKGGGGGGGGAGRPPEILCADERTFLRVSRCHGARLGL